MPLHWAPLRAFQLHLHLPATYAYTYNYTYNYTNSHCNCDCHFNSYCDRNGYCYVAPKSDSNRDSNCNLQSNIYTNAHCDHHGNIESNIDPHRHRFCESDTVTQANPHSAIAYYTETSPESAAKAGRKISGSSKQSAGSSRCKADRRLRDHGFSILTWIVKPCRAACVPPKTKMTTPLLLRHNCAAVNP
jgi:hypothetical protein